MASNAAIGIMGDGAYERLRLAFGTPWSARDPHGEPPWRQTVEHERLRLGTPDCVVTQDVLRKPRVARPQQLPDGPGLRRHTAVKATPKLALIVSFRVSSRTASVTPHQRVTTLALRTVEGFAPVVG